MVTNSRARNAAPDGWWVGKKVYAAFGWGKSVKGKVIYHKNGVIKLEDGTMFKESDAYDLYVDNARACNTGKAMVSRRGSDWYYAWAEGSQNGEEGPFQTEEQATLAAKQDGFKIANARACNSTNAIVRKALNACARNKAPEGWWEGKTIFAAFGWGKSVKGKVVSHKGGIIKLEDGTSFKETDAYDLYAINSCAKNGTIGDLATVKRDIEQSLRKMADFAAKFTGAKTTPSSALNDPMYSGYIELTFPTEEESANFNPYYLINKLGDDKSLLPRWAWGIYGFNYNRNGRTWRIKIGRFAT